MYDITLIIIICYLIKALIERGDEAATQSVDDITENTFLHVAARSGSLRSIQVSDTC